MATRPRVDPIDNIEKRYGDLLSADLLREVVGDIAVGDIAGPTLS